MAKKKKQEEAQVDDFTAIGKVEPRPIVEEMQTSYLDYAMSVIVSRALPDIRDGLKPVQRRILYAMWDIGLKSQAKFRKSATVVGEVLGKYHPHGDSSVYEAMVRMAQDFSMRSPLVNGQGNFGSMDGDRAAAMRYTECKLMPIAEELLLDLEKDTVDFHPNYDGSQNEPRPLPGKLPNFLVNGTLGIAVGMATNVPPHNLREVCNAISCLIENKDASVEDLMKHLKGPDFPTGGIIYNNADIKQAYATGKGGIVIRAKAEIEEVKGKHRIVVSEIPYQVNKSTLIEKIAALVRDKKLEGISGLRDESNKDGVHIVIELKKDAYPQKVLNQLYKMTSLQDKFHVNMLALVDGIQPRVLTLKMVLEEYLKHRKEVIRRRTEHDLAKAKAREHILEGLVKALDHIDAIIKLIRASADRPDAKEKLMKKYKFTEIQTNAILDMRLHQLANLERKRIEDELKEIKAIIKDLESILASAKKVLGIIKEDIAHLSEKYGEDRRTEIVPTGIGEFSQEDLIPKEDVVIMLTRDGYIKRLSPDTFKSQGRGGKGVIGLTTKEEDMVEKILTTNTHSQLLFFTTRGRVFQLHGYEVPVASRTSKGQALVNFLSLHPAEKVSAILSVDDMKKKKFFVMVTQNGVIKRVDLEAFSNIRTNGLIALKLKGEDKLEWVKPSTGKQDIMLVSSLGQAIRFHEADIRSMGRAAAGVRGMRLKENDRIIGMDLVDGEEEKESVHHLLVVTETGYGKRSNTKEYKVQKRGGSGIKTANVTKKTGPIVSARVVLKEMNDKNIEIKGDLVIVSSKGQVIRLPLKSVNVLKRATQGVRLMRLKDSGATVASVTLV
ncbi:MAG: DNA gyrase subunit A [Candidatus Jacksonbacteria bacterium]|jgi:DNA gyrase subunit A|nr:DNA gyrase subunit A [Candidatus Jacksonbacteria bacterium]MBT6034545.1 DNA gyrase subunit A [Candidatus Jacksonbacteria bacterium]MBT6300987.1 DNA gyrase subunit A [Candidatus Jacksonbacteria bacterium]MBT6756905.1 DNA gyrase subunit A [Candidatus Jacksonbacteria bacterium]MBT6955451.1 DNA gyrase subunit A [Candidatus Jacksonbacteria bacterium]